MRWASGNGVSPSAVVQGPARLGMARLGRPRSGAAWAAMAARRAYGPSLPPSLVDKARRGPACSGRAGRDRVRLGKGCRQQHWGLRLPVLLSLEGRYGEARRGTASRGMVSPGLAWCGYC